MEAPRPGLGTGRRAVLRSRAAGGRLAPARRAARGPPAGQLARCGCSTRARTSTSSAFRGRAAVTRAPCGSPSTGTRSRPPWRKRTTRRPSRHRSRSGLFWRHRSSVRSNVPRRCSSWPSPAEPRLHGVAGREHGDEPALERRALDDGTSGAECRRRGHSGSGLRRPAHDRARRRSARPFPSLLARLDRGAVDRLSCQPERPPAAQGCHEFPHRLRTRGDPIS